MKYLAKFSDGKKQQAINYAKKVHGTVKSVEVLYSLKKYGYAHKGKLPLMIHYVYPKKKVITQ